MINEYYTFKIYGYHSDDLKPQSHKYVVVVCDGCGLYNSISMYQYNRANGLCPQCADKYRGVAISKTKLSPKYPLPDGWTSKLSDITNNKECTSYLGGIAETILSNIYSDVRVMPYGNHGYDIICNKDFMIDIKSSAIGDKYGYWLFIINKNQIADYFLCIAFNNRNDLKNPVHLWMIPGYAINHLSVLSIRKGTIDKWQQYELSLDKLVACCDNLSV